MYFFTLRFFHLTVYPGIHFMTATRDLLHSFFKSRVYSTSLYTTVLLNCYPMCGDLCVPNILQLQIMIQQPCANTLLC